MNDAAYAIAAAEVDDGLRKLAIPDSLHDGLRRYTLDGGEVGSFLTAAIDNDLREAVCRADPESLAWLKPLVLFLHNYAPGGCYGSQAIRRSWQERGGVRGRKES